MDASITSTARKPKGKKAYEVVEDRNECEGTNDELTQVKTSSIKEIVKHGVDTEAA